MVVGATPTLQRDITHRCLRSIFRRGCRVLGWVIEGNECYDVQFVDTLALHIFSTEVRGVSRTHDALNNSFVVWKVRAHIMVN